MSLDKHPKILEIENRILEVEKFQRYCAEHHASHDAKDNLQHVTAEMHLELINQTISSQQEMAVSIKSLSDSLGSISKFIEKNESVLESVVSIMTGLKSLKKIIIGIATIVTALGVILGAGITIWAIFNAPSIVDALLSLRNIS